MLEHRGIHLFISTHLVSVWRLMNGDKDAERMPVQDRTLTHVSTHLGRCHLLVTGERICCPGGRDPTRCASVFLKELKFLHSRVPSVCGSWSNLRAFDSECLSQGV